MRLRMSAIAAVGFAFAVAVAGCGAESHRPDKDLSPGPDLGNVDTDLAPSDDAGTTCVGSCTLGAKSCDGNGVRTCVASGGCADWSAAVACGGAQICSGGVCATSCTNQCTAGATYCSGNGIRTCVTTVSGCTDWSPTVTACPNSTVCSGGVCDAACTDRCAAAAHQCAGGLQTCEKKASGCLDWGDPVPCAGGQVCSGGSCAIGCSDQCAANAKQCMGPDSLQTCERQASGCLDWSIAQVCSSGTCTAGVCTPCVNNAKRCGSLGNVETCNSGVWTQTASCAFGCTTGSCNSTQTCTPGAYHCNGNAVEICNAAGTAFLYTATCAVACSSGLCTGQCTPGQKRCNSKNLELCDVTGTTWNVMTACPIACDGPSTSCALDKLDITVDTDLNGEVVVNGPVTVTQPAKITSTSGNLTLRATSISIGAGAQIVISATGSTPDGVPTGFCTNSVNDGSGGGYGSVGGLGACSSTTYIGKSWGFTTDAAVAPGSPGGDGYYGCNNATGNGKGGKGGGMLKLIASTVTINGQVSANGQGGTNAVSSNCGGGGGGSGGGILIAADQLTVGATATINATGGSAGGVGTGSYNGGKGGDGRIKLLYGTSKSLNGGTIQPAATVDLLPPINISSTTHPSQNLFYNDGFPAVGLAWNKPFPSASYWYRVNTAPSSVPAADTISTFLATELVSISPALIALGTTADYYFHIAPIDATSVVGKVEQPYRLRINSTPPKVTSPTHPSSTTWYTAGTAFFQWAGQAPITAANDDANFKGFYYVLDHYGDTVPTTAATFLPITQKQINIANLLPAAGSTNGSADGVWGFHLLTMDTKGYLTKNATHYLVRIAAATPAASNVSGQVFEDGATTKPLQGATVTVNRKLIVPDVTSDATGNYNFGGNIPVGTWELRASKAGYTSATQLVAVGNTTATANFTLQKIP